MIEMVDVATAIRRFDAISVGDAGPHIRGATVVRDWIDYDPSIIRDGYRHGARSIHANAFRKRWRNDETHQRDRERE